MNNRGSGLESVCEDSRFEESAAKQAAEKVDYGVIPSEARNPSLFITQEKRDSSANSVPRNDNILSFSAACKAVLKTGAITARLKSLCDNSAPAPCSAHL